MLQLRPISTFDFKDVGIKETPRIIPCSVYVSKMPCKNRAIGHLWPSDALIIRFYQMKKPSDFPTLKGPFLCGSHQQMYDAAFIKSNVEKQLTPSV